MARWLGLRRLAVRHRRFWRGLLGVLARSSSPQRARNAQGRIREHKMRHACEHVTMCNLHKAFVVDGGCDVCYCQLANNL